MTFASTVQRGNVARRASLIAMLTLVLLGAPDASARLYRWVDAEGNVHYTDKLPPKASRQGHTELSTGGMRVETVAPPPTPEERVAAEALARQRAAEDARIERQQQRDRQLMASFQVVDDVLLAREGRIATIDARSQILRDRIRTDQELLRELHAQAEKGEAGIDATLALQARLIEIEQRIIHNYADMIVLEREKDAAYAEFSDILRRFLILKRLPLDEALTARRPEQPNLLHCPERQTCQRWWEQGRDYVEEHFGEAASISSIDMVVASNDSPYDVLTLTLARVPDPDGEQTSLFLDLYCKSRLTGDTTCRNADAIEVRDGLREALQR